MSAPRIIVPGATTAITRRTTLRKAFLAPWHPDVGSVWLYALAYAQWRTGVAVHHAIRVITHHHLTVTPETDNLPEFCWQFHHDVSCALNTLLARERYDSPRELFDGRSPHYMRLCDAPAQSSHLVYEYNNCVAAGLVARPEQMPDHVFGFDLWRQGSVQVRRPDVYFGPGRPETLSLKVTPPPRLYEAFDGDLDKLIYHMQRLADHARSAVRQVRDRPPLGARTIRRLHPWQEPRTLRERGGLRIPTFRVGTRGIVGQSVNRDAALETRAFRHRYREARLRHRAHDHTHAFPYGTYEMRVHHGAPVDAAPAEGCAIVTEVGPLLADVQTALGRRSQVLPAGTERCFALIEAVKRALTEEASDIVEHLDAEQGDFSQDGAAHANVPSQVVVRHRFSKHSSDGERGARRIVTLRDRRRGRPSTRRWEDGRRGADPPC